MHTNEPRELQGVELGYDPRDIDSKGIYKVVVYFFVFALVFFGGGYFAFRFFALGNGTSFDARKPRFEGPKVQGNVTAKIDIMEMRQHERAVMESYGTNPDGKQRIPVDRAIEVLSGRGLPTPADDTKATSPGNTITQNATGPAPAGTPTTPPSEGPGESVPQPSGSGTLGSPTGATP
jgi:hypothetical protein